MPDQGRKRSEPRRHHYVPGFYLRRFANKKSQVVQYDRDGRRGYANAVANCAVETDFYRLLGQDGSPSNDAEEFFNIVETHTSEAMRTIDLLPLGETCLDKEARLTLAIHIAFQFIRTREARDLANQLGDLIYRGNLELSLRGKSGDAFIEELTELAGRLPTENEISAARKFIEDPTATKILPSFNELYPMMVSAAFEVAPKIAARPWVLLECTAPAFLTSDRPVTFWRDRRRGDAAFGLGLDNADAVYFPLDPKKMLVVLQGPSDSLERRSPTRADVRKINAIVANWSYRFIYHHPNHRPVDKRILSQSTPLIVVNGRGIRRSENLWNSIRSEILREGGGKAGGR